VALWLGTCIVVFFVVRVLDGIPFGLLRLPRGSVVGKALVGSVGKALDARDFCAARPRIVGSAMAAAVALLIGVAELGLLDANSTGVSS